MGISKYVSWTKNIYKEVTEIKSKRVRINQAIRVREVRLIGEDGSQMGIVKTLDALKIAQEKTLDLVEVAPQAKPPVCKVMDYGKYVYEVQKKLRASRKKQVIVHLKEIKMRPNISSHDFDFKFNHIVKFLEKGDKVKLSIFFKGREMAHMDRGRKLIKDVTERLGDRVVVERSTSMETRRSMITVFAPKKTR